MRPEPETTAAPSLYRLMATYWDRYDLFAQAMRRTEHAASGSSSESAATDSLVHAGDNLDEVILQICAFVPTKMEDARIKANFVAALTEEKGGTLDAPEMAALIQSLPKLVLSEYARPETRP